MERAWSLIVGHPPGPLGWLLLIVCVGLALVELAAVARRGLAKRAARTGGARRARLGVAGIVILRVIAVLALLAVVLEIGVRVETFAGSSRRVVVLIDHSASMALADSPADAAPGEDARARFDRVRALWSAGAEARARWREDAVDVEVRGFAGEVTPLTRASADALELEPSGGGSELARALVELAEADAGEGAPLAGVVVISDGLVSHERASAEHLQDIVDSLAVPVTTVAAGGPTIRDVSIAALHVGEFAFVENVTEFSAELVAHGCEGERAEVTLLRDGEAVATQKIRLGGDGERREVSFEVAPDRTGQFVYELRVAPLAREASADNNRRAFVIKVLRDKVRVLHVAGRPDWDVRALRTLLKRDPNVELLSYYILRDFEDTARDDGTAPLSLIAFPTEQLFREELGSFDLLVMHNFDAAAHGDYLGNVATYVREGGSLVVIGGDLGLGSGDFAVPAFTRLMPIDMRAPLDLDREPFAPRLTESGRRHPITAWLAESERGDWRGLPALDSFNPAHYARHGAEVDATALLVHPGRHTTDSKQMPLLAVAEPGKGRVVTLTTGSTWRLGFAPDLPLIDGARPYDLLWLGAIRWLLRDASAERLVLEIDQAEHALGEPIELSVRTLSASYAPEPGVEVEFDIRALDPERAAEPAVAAARLTTDGLGRASTSIEALPAGAYQAEAWRADAPPRSDDAEGERDADGAPKLGQAARRVFLVGGGGRELALVDADPGTALLRDLAARSGGEFVDAVDGDELPNKLPIAALDQLDRRASGREDVPLWDGWLTLLIAIGAFGGEWILRRRVGGLG
ncbi:hypothetical protein ENSA5_24910 [Enhygromyxa salina]|uniref:Glutamine amidotransferase domain-containing protein n=1 Tax=Enhygromyxa salina TaxID=215803 RepID=A0A2S9YAW9_9BACT|nr:VWA domain-containing protein [Enhygromyxa salina]PRQ02255.1 hypothetical protein ENSA5_24910 [Enhygromyxa salina]